MMSLCGMGQSVCDFSKSWKKNREGGTYVTALLSWIKSMIYLTIFLTLLIQILPGGNYRKYVRFFAGLIFVISILQPLMTLVLQEDWEAVLLENTLSIGEQTSGELDISEAEKVQREAYAKQLGISVEELETLWEGAQE
jgi:stage III sporulation protein AF